MRVSGKTLAGDGRGKEEREEEAKKGRKANHRERACRPFFKNMQQLRGLALGFNGFVCRDQFLDFRIWRRTEIESHVVVAATELDGRGLALEIHEGEIKVGFRVFGVEFDGLLHFGFGSGHPSKVTKNDREIAMGPGVVGICVKGASECGEGEVGVAEAAVDEAEGDP